MKSVGSITLGTAIVCLGLVVAIAGQQPAPKATTEAPAPAPKPYAPVVKDAPTAPVKPPPALTRDPVQKALPPWAQIIVGTRDPLQRR